jgi:hypothetical protein
LSSSGGVPAAGLDAGLRDREAPAANMEKDMDQAGTGTWEREFRAGRADAEQAKSKGPSRATTARARRGPRSYEDWSKHDLYERARELGVPHRSKMTKGELIRALRHR